MSEGSGRIARAPGSESGEAARRARALDAILSQRVLGIVRSASAAAAASTARALIDGGLRAVELSTSTPGAIEAIAELVASRSDDSVAIGAGTILGGKAARAALQAGADLLVSPVVDLDVISAGREAGAAIIAGAATPTEAVTAVKAGADLVKLFPASAFSPAVVGDILQALPSLRLVPTGGVRIADVPQWLSAGAVAVGLGGALTAGEPDALRAQLNRLLGNPGWPLG
jgi:2-dehydro-3-deoxyphosphogluconate aldolase/(4S)-4-hydroxy-2-oxoglutarate aldolase